jgi:hypothetical protein
VAHFGGAFRAILGLHLTDLRPNVAQAVDPSDTPAGAALSTAVAAEAAGGQDDNGGVDFSTAGYAAAGYAGGAGAKRH